MPGAATAPVPLPTDRTVNLEPSSAEEVQLLGRGIIAAITPPGGLTELQAPRRRWAGASPTSTGPEGSPIPASQARRPRCSSELEVFAFIARANDDPRGFSLLAMVVSLFETGYLRAVAGLFESSPGQLSRHGVAVRLADAMRRGALTNGTYDFVAVDWFELAPLTGDEARSRFGVVAKGDGAVAAGSVGPWQLGGISEFQWRTGEEQAQRERRAYEPFGAAVL